MHLWEAWWTLRMENCSWNCPVVNLERVSEISVVFLLLHADVTVAEFGSSYLSVMDEDYYLPGETETWRQSQPRTALGSWPISQICAMASTDSIFFIWAASLPAAGEITSLLSDTPLLHASPVISRPQLDFELAGDRRKRIGSCAWAMRRGLFIGQRGQALWKGLSHLGWDLNDLTSLSELKGAGLSFFQHAETSLSLGEDSYWALNGWIGTWAKWLELETGKIME